MKFKYTILYVPSVPRILAFYELALGLKIRFLHESEDYGELETGECSLAFASHALAVSNQIGFQSTGPKGSFRNMEIAFTTENVPEAYARALKAGGAPVAAPSKKPWGQTVAYFEDPNGFLVELCTPIEMASS